MYGCESWTVKKAECQRIDSFELWVGEDCWEWSNQSILKEISPGCSLEGLMLKLKLQYFGHLMWRADSLEKSLMLGRIGGRRRRGWQGMRWLDGITNYSPLSLKLCLWKFPERVRLKMGTQPPSWIPRKIDKTLDSPLRRNMVHLDLVMSRF